MRGGYAIALSFEFGGAPSGLHVAPTPLIRAPSAPTFSLKGEKDQLTSKASISVFCTGLALSSDRM